MNKYQSVIAEIKDHTEHNLKIKLSAKTCGIVVQALQEKAEREKGCEYCKERKLILSEIGDLRKGGEDNE